MMRPIHPKNLMLSKLYIHHFRCLQNFEIDLSGISSALLLGRNGTGKSTVFAAFEILQKIGRGVSHVSELVTKDDFAFLDYSIPIVFEISAALAAKPYTYHLETDLPQDFHSLKVKKESLNVAGQDVFVREGGKTHLNGKAEFTLDLHHIGLPLISTRIDADPVAIFRKWLASIIYLDPVPTQIAPTSKAENPYLDKHLLNLVDWMRHHLALKPALYSKMEKNLRQWMPDFDHFKLEVTGREERELLFGFKDQKSIELNLTRLSDGEKTYILTAMLLAIIHCDQPFLCLWDEVDQYIALPELSHFITACRKEFEASNAQAQLILTTHNPRVMYEFSGHNSFVLSRTSHLQPSRLTLLQDKPYLSADSVQAYENGELG